MPKRGKQAAIAAGAKKAIDVATGGDRRLLISKTYRIDDGRAVRITLNDGRHLDFSAVAVDATLVEMSRQRRSDAKASR